jgi:hypothetical protein
MVIPPNELRSGGNRSSRLLYGGNRGSVSRWDRLGSPAKLLVAAAPVEPECPALPSGLVAEIDDVTSPLTPRQVQLLGYWNRIRGGRSMPARRDLDPAEVHTLLPNLVLIDVAEGVTDFRFRLMGTAVAAQCSRDHTSKLFSDLEGYGPRGYGWSNHQKVVTRQRPRIGHLPYTGPNTSIVAHHNLSLPLSSDGRRVDMILCISEFERCDGGTGVT